MYSIVQTWVELHTTISSGQVKNPQAEAQMLTRVEDLAATLKADFQKNEKLISELKILPKLDVQTIQKEHRDAVLDYKWMVREMLVWGEELDRKIDSLLPDRP